MFTIHGFFLSEPTERLLSNITQFSAKNRTGFLHEKCYQGEVLDFTKTYKEFEKNVAVLNSFVKKAVIVPPAIKVAQFYSHFCDFIVVRFPCQFLLSPCTNLPYFNKVLTDFLPVKHKTLIELSGECLNFNMLTSQYEILSYNQAILKCSIKGSKTFFDESIYSSYFTYSDSNHSPHLVFLEDTLSISKKHNLVKEKGYMGIAWKDVFIMADGNWESLRGAYDKI
ncbi:MAG: hypothetical protein IJE46_02035 [Clostridia bacterium]|nr:hypothetical protein [Clostridia bacterium]